MWLEISSKYGLLQSTVETVDKITRVTTLITGADCFGIRQTSQVSSQTHLILCVLT